MYSRGIRIEGNVLARSGGAAGVGLGLKESSHLEVRENALLANTVGIYVDTSPLEPGEPNLFERNAVRLGGAGVVFHGSARGNRFLGNSFRDNHAQVRVDGRGDALAAEWRGNDFDDYAGYDLDGDGIGDVPYALRSLSSELTGRAPALAFLRGSPALALVELLGRVVPLFEPRTLVVDAAPRLAALDPEPWRGD
jgi:nitrous oxidase accessory protein